MREMIRHCVGTSDFALVIEMLNAVLFCSKNILCFVLFYRAPVFFLFSRLVLSIKIHKLFFRCLLMTYEL